MSELSALVNLAVLNSLLVVDVWANNRLCEASPVRVNVDLLTLLAGCLNLLRERSLERNDSEFLVAVVDSGRVLCELECQLAVLDSARLNRNHRSSCATCGSDVRGCVRDEAEATNATLDRLLVNT